MTKIKFLRLGRKRQPFYKIVVTDKSNPPKGGVFKEELGTYNPKTKELKINKDRAVEWINKGSQMTDTIYNLFVKEGIVVGKKRRSHDKEPIEGEKVAQEEKESREEESDKEKEKEKKESKEEEEKEEKDEKKEAEKETNDNKEESKSSDEKQDEEERKKDDPAEQPKKG